MTRATWAPIIAVILLAGCGSGTRTPGSVRLSPDPAARPLVATVEGGFARNVSHTLHLLTVEGVEVAHIQLPPNAFGLKVAANAVYYVLGDELRRIDRAGANSLVTVLQGLTPDVGVGGIAVRLDGRAWAWTLLNQGPQAERSRLFVQEQGQSPRLLIDETKQSAYLRPARWLDKGILVIENRDNVGGYPFLFNDGYMPSARLLDPRTGATSPFSALSRNCALTDIGDDGSVACMHRQWMTDGGGPRTTVEVDSTDGISRIVHVPGPTYQVGNAAIAPRGKLLAIGVNHTDETDGSGVQGRVTTYVIDLAADRVVSTHDGALPGGWTADGRLVLQSDRLGVEEGIVVASRHSGQGLVWGILSSPRTWSPVWT